MVNFKHDYSGSLVEPFINEDTFTGDSMIFVQGMAGLNAKLSIPYAKNLKAENVIVNKAEMEVFVVILPEDEEDFHSDPTPQLFISKKNSDGDLVVITDVAEAVEATLSRIFGGEIEEIQKNNTILYRYKMNITSHLQEMIDGIEPNDEIFIYSEAKGQRPQRVVLFGPNHPEHPIKLNVTYTINQ